MRPRVLYGNKSTKPTYWKRKQDKEFDFFSSYLKKFIEEIVAYLGGFLDSNDLIGKNSDILPIITNLQN